MATAKTRPIQVLLANDRLGYDDVRFHGAGRLMVEWTRALLDRGLKVTPVILRDAGSLGANARAEGLPFVFLGRHPYDPRTVVDFVRLIQEHRIQVLHLQAFGASTFGRIAARLTGVPALVHVHADYRLEPKGYPWYIRVFDHVLAAGTRDVLAVSASVADFAVELQGFRRSQVQVVHNPVDGERFRPPNDDERATARAMFKLDPAARCVVCLARFHPVKGVDVLVEAWPRVVREVPGVVLLLAGDGPMRGALEERVRTLGMVEEIQFLGYREDVTSVLWAADVAVLPSRSEGLCVAALEAMATGLPLVATRVGGNPEIVHDGCNGFLVPSEDPDELADKLNDVLLERRASHSKLAAGALSTADDHGLQQFVERLEQIYRRLLDG